MLTKNKIIHSWIPPKLSTASNNFVFFPFQKKKNRTSLISLSFPGKKVGSAQSTSHPTRQTVAKPQPDPDISRGDISHGHHSRIL